MNNLLRHSSGFGMRPARLMITFFILVPIVIAAVLVWQMLKPSTHTVPTPEYWPTNGWRTTAPEAHGFDSAIMAEG